MGLANVLLVYGRAEEALPLARRFEEIESTPPRNFMHGQALTTLAYALSETGNCDEALDVLERAVVCGEECGSEWISRDAKRLAAEIRSKVGDDEE
jgi:hypothetical protein